jgi:hypothetical protein
MVYHEQTLRLNIDFALENNSLPLKFSKSQWKDLSSLWVNLMKDNYSS